MKQTMLLAAGLLRFSLGWAGVVGLSGIGSTARGDTVVTDTNQSTLVSALQAGGVVTFSFDGTILLTNTITISTNVILDGTNHSVIISGGGKVGLFNLPAGFNLTLRQLTLANGQLAGVTNYFGETYPLPTFGAAVNTAGNLDIENCIFTNNSVTSPPQFNADGRSTYGGAIYNQGTLLISNSLFVNNSALGGAGGGEHSQTGGSGLGGAIYNSGGTVNMGGVVFSNNAGVGGAATSVYFGASAGQGYGGAVLSQGGAVSGNNLSFFNNTAVGGGSTQNGSYAGPVNGGSAFGGALYLAGAVAAISNSFFSNNFTTGASADGGTPGMSEGGSVFNTGFAVFLACDFIACSTHGAIGEDYYGQGSSAAAGVGGAIYNVGNLQIQEGSLANNSAVGGTDNNPLQYLNTGPGLGMGGAVYNTGSLEVDGVILSQNSAVSPNGYNVVGPVYGNAWGGAIYNTGLVLLTNTLFSSNSTSAQTNFGQTIYNTGAFVVDTNSILIPNATGTPPLTYQLQANGTNIPGATNLSFNLSNIPFNTLGTYDVIISNSSGLLTNLEEILNAAVLTNAVEVTIIPEGAIMAGATWRLDGGTPQSPGAILTNLAVGSHTVSFTPISGWTTPSNQTFSVTNGPLAIVTGAYAQPPPVLAVSMAQLPPGTFALTIFGASGSSYIIQSSPDLVNWANFSTNAAVNGVFQTNITASGGHRFFRTATSQ